MMALIPDFLVGKKIREENSKSKGQHWVSTEKKRRNWKMNMVKLDCN